MFENLVLPAETINSIPRSGHFIIQNIVDVRLGDPRLLSGVVFVAVFFVIVWKLSFKESSEARNFNEELVAYSKALKAKTN